MLRSSESVKAISQGGRHGLVCLAVAIRTRPQVQGNVPEGIYGGGHTAAMKQAKVTVCVCCHNFLIVYTFYIYVFFQCMIQLKGIERPTTKIYHQKGLKKKKQQ